MSTAKRRRYRLSSGGFPEPPSAGPPRDRGRHRTPASGPPPDRRGFWALIAFGAALLIGAALMTPLATGGAPMITVENDNGEVVLVDYRSQSRAIGVDGPVAFTLAPGTAVTFSVPAGQTFCVRVIRPERQQVTASAGLVTRRGETPARVRVRAVEQSAGGASSPCPSSLADHRVRVSLLEYFEPHDPGSVRRERLLNRH